MKKLLSLLMLLCLTLTVAPAALAEEVVNVYNWEDYIAPEVLTLFTEETGIKVNYMCFTTNEDMIVQVEANPGAFDVCFPSDYIIERMIAKDLLAEINYDNVPNFEQDYSTSSAIPTTTGEQVLRARICGERSAFCTTRT